MTTERELLYAFIDFVRMSGGWSYEGVNAFLKQREVQTTGPLYWRAMQPTGPDPGWCAVEVTADGGFWRPISEQSKRVGDKFVKKTHEEAEADGRASGLPEWRKP